MGASDLLQHDPHFRDHLLFNEYYHGETGAGLGASHQTGWSGLIALTAASAHPAILRAWRSTALSSIFHTTSSEGAMTTSEMDRLCINTIRTLAIDAIQKAKSGHPGTPMGMAPVAYGLWQKRLNFDPADPIWPNRDRFILSAGHASMLLYALLHLTKTQAVDADYEPLGRPSVTLDDIKTFRQLGSACPGHPEYHLTSGVEATTGPLGQGVAMSVGLAIAERWLGALFQPPGLSGGGLAHLRAVRRRLHDGGDLGRGGLSRRASEAQQALLDLRFQPRVASKVTPRSPLPRTSRPAFSAMAGTCCMCATPMTRRKCLRAFDLAARGTGRPTLIIIESHIGYGAPHKQDTPEAHGEPLGEDEVKATKRFYGWPEDAQFLVPDGVYQHFADGIGARGAAKHAQWRDLVRPLPQQPIPNSPTQFEAMQGRELPPGWDQAIPRFPADPEGHRQPRLLPGRSRMRSRSTSPG